jgi:glycerol-3-phosphate acyltransferase PlsY
MIISAVFVVGIFAAYFIGSIPFGLIIARAHGINLRAIGSGNIGATNVSRALGKKWAYLCFVFDALKGFIPTLGTMLLAKSIAGQEHIITTMELWLWLLVGCSAILGHIFPLYVGFKGGKGVSTSFGVALGIWPYFTVCALIVLIIWTLVLFGWRYVSLASISAAVAFPLILVVLVAVLKSWQFANLWPLIIVATVIPIVVTVRHRDDIKRLLSGTENKISTK